MSDTSLESLIAGILLDPNIRDSCSVHVEPWMFTKRVYEYFTTTILQPEFNGKPINKKLFLAAMKNKYEKTNGHEPLLDGGDWILINNLFDSYIEIIENDFAPAVRIVEQFVKDRLHQKGADLYARGRKAEAEGYFVSGSLLKISHNPFINPLESGIMDKLWERDMPPGGVPIKSSLGVVNTSLLYSGYKNGDLGMVVLRPKGGKCLAVNTPVIMYDGTIKKVQDVAVGDLLLGPDSLPRTVLGTNIGRETMYKITPNKGDSYTVNESHILSLKDTDTREVVNISVKDFLSRSEQFRMRHKGWRPDTVQFKPHDDIIEVLTPYFLGLWLGDEHSSVPSITTCNKEIEDYVHDYAKSIGLLVSIHEQENNKSVVLYINSGLKGKGVSNILFDALRKFDLIDNKHIPHRHKTATQGERLALLAGIIDADGHFCVKENGVQSFEITFKSEKLLDDTMFVARSLGFSCYKKECVKTCGNNGVSGVYYRCKIHGDIEKIPTKVMRKKDSLRTIARKRGLLTEITIENVGEDDYYGFELNGDGLFLLGDFTVTHNTTFLVQEAASAAHQGFNAAHLFFGDMSEFDGICMYCANITGDPLLKVIQNYKAYVRRCERWLDHVRIARFPALSMDCYEVISAIRRLKRQFAINLCILDYDLNIRQTANMSGMYESGGVMYSAFKGAAEEMGYTCLIGSQPKQQYWPVEVLPPEAASESSRKQQAVDFMIHGGRNKDVSTIGTFWLPYVRRGISEQATKVRFEDGCRSIKDISSKHYDRLYQEGKSNKKDDVNDDAFLEGIRFEDHYKEPKEATG